MYVTMHTMCIQCLNKFFLVFVLFFKSENKPDEVAQALNPNTRVRDRWISVSLKPLRAIWWNPAFLKKENWMSFWGSSQVGLDRWLSCECLLLTQSTQFSS